MKKSPVTRIGCGLERLESREMLTSVPFGASTQDTTEFMLGNVGVNVVFLESNGVIDADTEQWTPELAEQTKLSIEEGLQWWVDALDLYSDVHYLNFHVDYTLADNPFQTSYEPISRGSQDFVLWIEEFFREAAVPSSAGFTTEIRTFNHQQRIANETDWSFTIFVVNSDNDPNGRFGDANAKGTVFQRAFAYPGGQFIVMPNNRPAATVTHEVGHMFWAFDEYSGSDTYTSRRGYYATQNTNAFTGNPDPDAREPSIMASTSAPFVNQQISQSARETIGWRDSDGDGIFDVLDVPHVLTGNATFDPASRTVKFVGQSSVQTLNNLNTAGTGNDITLNRITDLQYRIDHGTWIGLQEFNDHVVTIDVMTPSIPDGSSIVELRSIDNRIGVHSNSITITVSDGPSLFQNPENQYDVSGDGFVTAIDALQVIMAINEGNFAPTGDRPPFLDVSGDSIVSSRDVLMVINHINAQTSIGSQARAMSSQSTTDTSTSRSPKGALEATGNNIAATRTASSMAVLALFSSNSDENRHEFWDKVTK